MTVGNLILILLGILYGIWSYQCIKDLRKPKYDGPKEISILWFILTMIVICMVLFIIILNTWNYKLF